MFNGELARLIGVGAGGDVQMPPQGLLHPLRSGDVAGRAAADPQNMFARRLVAEHVVKGRNTRNGGRADVGQLAQARQRLLGQVAVMFLERLQNRDQRLGFAADALHRFLDKIQFHALA